MLNLNYSMIHSSTGAWVRSPRSTQPRDDFFTSLTTIEVDGRKLTNAELRGYGSLVLLAGREASIDRLSNVLWYLADHPEDRRRLIDEPGLIRTAVEEFLRSMSPIQLLGRVATRPELLLGAYQ